MSRIGKKEPSLGGLGGLRYTRNEQWIAILLDASSRIK